VIFDAHSDIPTFLYDVREHEEPSVLEKNFERFFGQYVGSRVMSVWSRPDKRASALRYALEAVMTLKRDVERSASFELVTSVDGMHSALKRGRVALWLGLEGGEPLEDSLDLLDVFYSLGLRVLTLTWSLRNAIGDGVFERTNGGLTNFGVEVVGKAEELGIVVDLSHINEAGFWDALDVTGFPVIASHSNARALCDNPRNLTDDQIQAIAERDGVIGAVAIPGFVDRERPTLDRYVEHIVYMAELAGPEHVGIGFDFLYYLSGWSGKSVEGFEDESRIPALIEKLQERFTEKEVDGIAFKNFERAFKRVTG